ncbi:MAG: biotin/lipoyl-binding protein [Acidobacteria bacterium]|nr:biotin/lipoyl-binding protein [Acidobacteriota bacterium]
MKPVLLSPPKPEAIEVEPGVWSVLVDGASFELRVNGEQFDARGLAFVVETEETAQARQRASRGPAKIATTMPGKVIRLLVADGDTVTAGQGIVVVEAMKMQNEIKSPKDGVVKGLKAQPGSTVTAGQTLALIE